MSVLSTSVLHSVTILLQWRLFGTAMAQHTEDASCWRQLRKVKNPQSECTQCNQYGSVTAHSWKCIRCWARDCVREWHSKPCVACIVEYDGLADYRGPPGLPPQQQLQLSDVQQPVHVLTSEALSRLLREEVVDRGHSMWGWVSRQNTIVHKGGWG